MKKLINDPATVVEESLDGFAAAHADIVFLDAQRRYVRRRERATGKVALISGGGSGHEPLHAGFVGYGMLDAACPGAIFTSPTPDGIIAAIEDIGASAGALLIVKNYEGDVMNFAMAAEMSSVATATVLVDDDVAVPRSSFSTGRRGVAGCLVVEKIVGAAAEESRSLEGLVALGAQVNAQTRSMGLALTSCVAPAAGRPTFALGASEAEMGVGIHGEPGRRRIPLAGADELVGELVRSILDDGAHRAGDECLLFVNGFGGTPSIELYLVFNVARRLLAESGVVVARSLVGSYVTSLDMAGASVTVTKLDADLMRLWDAPVRAPALRW